jgi:hypothetical protein
MINPFKEVNWRPSRAEKKKFALSLVIGCPVLAALFLVSGRISMGAWDPKGPLALALAGISVGLLLWLVPALARPVYVICYLAACCIGIVVGNLLLMLIFYGVVTGIGLVLLFLGKRPIARKLNRSAVTYWQDAGEPTDTARYFRQF